MSIVSSMAPLHLLHQDHEKEMQLDFFGHVIPLTPASASCHGNGIMNGTTEIFSQDNQNEVQSDFFGHVMHMVLALASCDAGGIVNGTATFVSSRYSKLGPT